MYEQLDLFNYELKYDGNDLHRQVISIPKKGNVYVKENDIQGKTNGKKEAQRVQEKRVAK